MLCALFAKNAAKTARLNVANTQWNVAKPASNLAKNVQKRVKCNKVRTHKETFCEFIVTNHITFTNGEGDLIISFAFFLSKKEFFSVYTEGSLFLA
jgi:hypothetical protein